MADLLGMLRPTSEKRAAMARSPALRFAVANVAWPPARSTVPSLVEPSKNVTLPVAGEPAPTTAKVNTTGWPNGDGFTEELNVAPPGVPVVPPPVTVVGALAARVVGVDGAVVTVVPTVVVGNAPVVEVEAVYDVPSAL